MSQNITKKTLIDGRGFSQSDRSSGYKSTYTALAELVDNSFDANAKDVELIFVETLKNGRKVIDEIIVADNGDGMPKEIVEDCLTQGFSGVTDLNHIVKHKRLGKFGMGLPRATKSITERIEVYSWQNSSETFFQYLDLAEREKTNDIFVYEAEQKILPKVNIELFSDIYSEDHGTVILLKNVDRITHARSETAIRYSETLLGRIYRYLVYQNKKNIYLSWWDHSDGKYTKQQRVSVKPNDPLFLMENSYLAPFIFSESNINGPVAESYKKFSISENEHKPLSNILENHSGEYSFKYLDKNYKYSIKTSIADKDIMQPGIRNGGDAPLGRKYRDKRDQGQISFVRSDREIDQGDFGQFYKVSVPENRFWSIEVHFDADMDDLFSVANNKQSVSFWQTKEENPSYDPEASFVSEAQQQLYFEISVRISEAIKDAFKEIKDLRKKWDDVNNPIGPGVIINTPTTTTIVKKEEGNRPNDIPEKELEPLIERLKSKYPELDEKEIKGSITSLEKQKTKASLLYIPLESGHLWDYSKALELHVIEINTNHAFYEKIIKPLQYKNDDKTLSAIELFIIALVIEEAKTIQDEDKNRWLQKYRVMVASKLDDFMHAYISSTEDEDDNEEIM